MSAALHTYTEAARLLSVSPRTLDRLISAGEIAVVTVRRSKRISDSEIERFVAANTRPTRAAVVSPFKRRNA